MRRLRSERDEKKRIRRNQLLVGGVLIFLMFFSTLGYAFQSIGGGGSEDNGEKLPTIKYNGFEFKEQNGFWILNKDSTNFIFRKNPNQVAKINSIIFPLDNYLDKTLYIYSESVEAESEIRTNLIQFVDGIKNACLQGEVCEEGIPIKTCSDNFIIIKEKIEGESTGIIQENNCIFIRGGKTELTELSDGFLFKLLGVES